MTEDLKQGKAQGLFSAGELVENLHDMYKAELNNLSAMKVAFAMAQKRLEDYRSEMIRELDEAKLNIKEAEYGKTYVTRCIELLNQMFIEAEAKRLMAEGGTTALRRSVESIKKSFDQESVTLRSPQNKSVKTKR